MAMGNKYPAGLVQYSMGFCKYSGKRLSLFLVILNTLLFTSVLETSGQNLQKVRQTIDTLCSKTLFGRGFLNDGHQKGADYISARFKNSNLIDLYDGYQQEFSIKANTFPKEPSLIINRSQLKVGRDFIPDACSGTLNGKFKLQVLSYGDLELADQTINKLKDKTSFVLLDVSSIEKRNKDFRANLSKMSSFLENTQKVTGLILIDKKLTWNASTEICPKPTFTILKEKLGSKPKKVAINIENTFIDVNTQNVVGLLRGREADSVIVISAHYDHLGGLGDEIYMPGANDNASGVAMMLDLADYYSKIDTLPKYSIAFIAFGAEESGILGSQYFVENPPFPIPNVKFVLNLDITGTGDEGITVVNGKINDADFWRLEAVNNEQKIGLDIKARGESCNSDHCPFDQKGIKTFFIYTRGGSQAYHDINDQPENLSLSAYNELFLLLTGFIKGLK